MRPEVLRRRIQRLEASQPPAQPWHLGLMERMKIYRQIEEGTANSEDPTVQECVARLERYREYFANREAQR